MTREEIYKNAIEKRRHDYPQFDPYQDVASLLGISSKTLYAIVKGERHFKTVIEEERFFRECNYPEGLDEKKLFLFPKNDGRRK